MKTHLLFISALFCNVVYSQHYLTQAGLNRALNRAFGNIVSGQSTGTEIANYASLDPANGSFTFKGVLPVGNGRDTGRLSFLNLKIEGGLISDSYAALFTNSSLNTNASIQAEYNFRIGKPGISYIKSDRVFLEMQRNLLQRDRIDALRKIDIIAAHNQDDADAVRTQVIIFQNQYSQKQAAYIIVRDSVQLYLHSNPVNLSRTTILTDSVTKLRSNLSTLEDTIIITNRKRDSLLQVIAGWGTIDSIRGHERIKVDTTYRQKLIQLEDAVAFTGIRLSWFTLIASGGKKNYYTFDGTLPFPDQIAKHQMNTYRFGLAWNYYNQSFFLKRALYFNIGFARMKDNNTALLSTTSVTQEKTITNEAEDTVRTIEKKYNAYTDPVTEQKYWNLYANVYYLFGKKTSGLHIFPSVNIVDSQNDIASLGLGYVISFTNQKKDQPVINAEGYVNFTDMFNRLNGKEKFWNRNEIGIRFTLPFNFLLNK